MILSALSEIVSLLQGLQGEAGAVLSFFTRPKPFLLKILKID